MSKLPLLLCFCLTLQGCAGALLLGSATGASIIHDRRTAGSIVEDENIELKAYAKISKNDTIKSSANINVTSFNSRVLITGQANNAQIKSKVGDIVRNIEKVKSIHNEVRLAAPSSTLTRSSDIWITSKVKMMMLAEKNLDPTRIKVVTENGEVFLLGLVNKNEASKAIAVTRNTAGVQKVIELFEFIQL